MKKINADDYYIEYIKRDFARQLHSEKPKEDITPKEKIREALKKNFTKDEQKFYSLV
jgi:hypothetical protein